ncbi:MAG TPA: hypothetical protein VF747_18065, partial [Blastocatellia bacterium]
MSKTDNSEQHTGSKFQFPNSDRIYIEGSREGLRVPMREVRLNITRG